MRPLVLALTLLVLAAAPAQARPAACSDGFDNDGDSHADGADPGCSSPWDGSEADDGLVQDCLNLTAGKACADVRAPASCDPRPRPGPPTSLSASRELDGVRVEWHAPLGGLPVDHYTLYRGVAHADGFVEATLQPLATVPGTVLTYFDDAARPDVRYVYWATAEDDGCEGAPSNPALVGRPDDGSLPPDLGDCIYLWGDPVDAVQNASLGCLPEDS